MEWKKLNSGYRTWLHVPSGWKLCHCGHPTALWPYYCVNPAGGPYLLTGGIGLGLAFRTVKLAKAAIENHIKSQGAS